MDHKGKIFPVLVIVLFLVSLACNLPSADNPWGERVFNAITRGVDSLLCDLTGGDWVPFDPDFPGETGYCYQGPIADNEKPSSEGIDAGEEYSPQAAVTEPPSVETDAPADEAPADAPQPAVKADLKECVTYDLALSYVNETPTTTVRYTQCSADLAVKNYSLEPMLVVWHLIYDNDPNKGQEDVWKSKKLEPNEAFLLGDGLFTSKWNNGEYYYRKVVEIGMIRYVPECEHLYLNLTYQEPPAWFAEVAKPLDEFSCP